MGSPFYRDRPLGSDTIAESDDYMRPSSDASQERHDVEHHGLAVADTVSGLHALPSDFFPPGDHPNGPSWNGREGNVFVNRPLRTWDHFVDGVGWVPLLGYGYGTSAEREQLLLDVPDVPEGYLWFDADLGAIYIVDGGSWRPVSGKYSGLPTGAKTTMRGMPPGFNSPFPSGWDSTNTPANYPFDGSSGSYVYEEIIDVPEDGWPYWLTVEGALACWQANNPGGGAHGNVTWQLYLDGVEFADPIIYRSGGGFPTQEMVNFVRSDAVQPGLGQVMTMLITCGANVGHFDNGSSFIFKLEGGES